MPNRPSAPLKSRAIAQGSRVILSSPPNIGLQPTAARCDAEPLRLKPGVRRILICQGLGMTSSAIDETPVPVQHLRVTSKTLEVVLRDGRTLSVPLEWYPRLAHGSRTERQRWRLIGEGIGIHWPDLDEDISIAGLLAGLPSGESPSSLKQWLASRRQPPDKALQPANRARRVRRKPKNKRRAARG